MPAMLSLESENRFHDVVADYLASIDAGEVAPLSTLIQTYPEFEEQITDFFSGQEQIARLAAPFRDSSSWSHYGKQRAETIEPPSLAGYEVLGEIGRGGMGVVFQVRQTALNRIVALKTVRSDASGIDSSARRLRLEAEFAAGLDHPNILPVYEVGEQNGLVFFSMKWAEGGSLAASLERFQADPTAAARLVMTLALAVQHAHERGVLHRDLKPSNVVFDAAGTPFITDFGLARRVGFDSELTATGALVGTPSYMAPEQLQSPRRPLTTAADVHGLGAILYAVLTGSPPFRGDSFMETVDRLRTREPDSPSKSNPRVSRDLATICLKCLRKNPAERYASARELADDLERFLSGKPVRARAIGALAKLGRWCRRNPALAGLATTLLLTAVAGVITITILWFRADEHARKEAEQARAAAAQALIAETERNKARADLALAIEAVRKFIERISDEELDKSAGPHAISPELADEAQAYLERIIARHPIDSAADPQIAELYHLAGELRRSKGQTKQALADFERERDIYHKLHDQEPENSDHRRSLGIAQARVGFALQVLERAQEAARELGRAEENLLPFADAEGRSGVQPRHALAVSAHSLARIAEKAGDFEKSQEMCRLALMRYEGLVRLAPAEPRYRRGLASVQDDLGLLLSRKKETASDAAAWHAKAIAYYEEVLRKQPRSVSARGDWAIAVSNQARALWTVDRKEEAVAAVGKIITACDALAKERPNDQAVRQALAEAYHQRGSYHSRERRRKEALADYLQAIENQAAAIEAAASHERKPSEELARYLFDAGVMYGELGQRPQAREVYEKSRTIYRELLAVAANDLKLKSRLAGVLNNLGVLMAKDNEMKDARKTLQEGIDLRRAVYKSSRTDDERRGLNYLIASLAEVARVEGSLKEAADLTEERLPLCGKEPLELFRAARDFCLFAGRVAGGKSARTPEENKQRQAYLDRSFQVLQQARAAGFRDATRLRSERAFDIMKDDERFQRFVDELK